MSFPIDGRISEPASGGLVPLHFVMLTTKHMCAPEIGEASMPMSAGVHSG